LSHPSPSLLFLSSLLSLSTPLSSLSHRVSSSSHHHQVRPLTPTKVALPPPPRSHSHHHHDSWGGKVHGGWRRQGPWRLEDGSLVAAGGGKAHGCWKRGRLWRRRLLSFLFFFRFRFGLV
ncbi:unnamed protein product, partial [Brassica rapa subsp. trilocularis]